MPGSSTTLVRGKREGPLLFFYKSDKALTCPKLVQELRKVLPRAGLEADTCKFAGHSFRIGAVRTAAACNISADMIKTLGQWKSQAYQLYVGILDADIASITKKLADSRM